MHPFADRVLQSRKLHPGLFFLAILPLLGFFATGLMDLDEGFYGSIVGEMLRSGDWIVPHYNGEPWFEKPILLYWISAPFVAIFGEVFGPRLGCVLSTIATYWVVWRFVAKWLDLKVAYASLLVLSTSLVFVATGQMMMTDPPFVLALTLCLTQFYESLHGNRQARIWSALFLGVAFLAKGPAAGLIFLLIIGFTAWRIPELRPGFRGGWLLGTAVFVLAVLSWYLPAYMASRELFVEEFIIKQNIGRFSGGDEAHKINPIQGLAFFPIVLFLGLFPWSLQVGRIFKRNPELATDQGTALRFFLIWFLVIFVFFTVSGSKLIHYMHPGIVPLSVLLGYAIVQKKGLPISLRNPRIYLATVLVFAISLNVAVQAYYTQIGQREAHALAKEIKKYDQPIVLYQLPRRNADRGTGKPKLQETSLPSVIFYLNRVVWQSNDFRDVLNAEKESLIFTRWNRITDDNLTEAKQAGFTLERLETIAKQQNYHVYRMVRSR